ncbi:MAG TPA: HPF/RaiA family ribosome-associated protein [Sandaracinaceae bacterium]
MKTPLRITFQGLDPSPALEERIRRKAAKLERFCDRITSCHVVVERPPAHKQHGGTYHVRIHLEVPGGRLDVAREPGRDQAHEDVYVALRDAFDRAARMLDARHARRHEAG